MQTFDNKNLQKQSELQSILLDQLTDINYCFSAKNIHELFDRLNQLKSTWAADVISLLEKKSALIL